MTELYQDATGEMKARSLVDASMIAGETIVHDAAAVDLEHAENRFQSGQYIVLDMAAQARRDQRVRVRLVEAGEALLTALNAVATDRELWRRLASSDLAMARAAVEGLSYEREMQLREILAHNVPEMLRHLGYRTPPPPPKNSRSRGCRAR